MDSAASFGQWVRRQRKALDITQEELADRVGCARSTIRMIEGGERRPSRQLVALLADRLGIAEEAREAFLRLARESQADGQAHETRSASAVEVGEAHRTPTNLRQAPTRIIGRTGEMEEIEHRLLQGGASLITLTGPPGVGKTSLAHAVAEDLLHSAGAADMPASTQRFADGVFFIGLATVTDTELVAPTIAQTLELREATEPPMEVLKKHLRTRRMLLVLDNFEQVIEAAPLLSELILECPGLACMVTSREPLHVRGEQQFEVSSLPWPGKGELHSVEDMLKYPAVALFVERAQSVDHTFRLAEDNAEAVATLCAYVDGLPLAIELVAARVKLLPPAALVQRFRTSEGHTSLQLFSGGGRDLPERHRTLRNAIGWSYDLLNEGERILFSRLGVFAGGCTLNSVESVCNARADLSISVLEGLQSLLDKSLLKRESRVAGGPSYEIEPRYTMLEMVREYAAERLEEGGEAAKVRGWFFDYYLALAEAARVEVLGERQKVWMAKLEAEHDNIRAALRWSIDMGRIDVAAQVAGGLSNYWYMSSNINEGRAWLEELAEHEGLAALAPQVQAQIVSRAGFLALALYRGAQAIRRFEQSLPIARQAGDEAMATTILGYMSLVEMRQGNYARAESLAMEALAASREQHIPRNIARSLHNLALILLYKGEYDRAVSLEEEAIPVFYELGDKWSTSNALGLMGIALAKNGEAERAHGVANEAAALIEGLSGNNDVIGLAITCKAEVAKARGDYQLAEALYRDSLRKVGKTGSYIVIALNLIGLGLMAVSRGEAARAVTLFGALDGLSERMQVAFVTPCDRPQYERSLTDARTSLGEQEWSQAWARGRAMSPDEALAFALEEIVGI